MICVFFLFRCSIVVAYFYSVHPQFNSGKNAYICSFFHFHSAPQTPLVGILSSPHGSVFWFYFYSFFECCENQRKRCLIRDILFHHTPIIFTTREIITSTMKKKHITAVVTTWAHKFLTYLVGKSAYWICCVYVVTHTALRWQQLLKRKQR